jgi:hypothetical protein
MIEYVFIHSFFEYAGGWIRSCSVCGAAVHEHASAKHTTWHEEQNR